MLAPYRTVLSRPGTRAFAAAGLLSRLPIAMFNISLILMVQIQYDSYEVAGQVAAAGVVVWALQTVPTSRLVDRFGQRAVMWPLTGLHVVGVIIAIWTAMVQGPVALVALGAVIASVSGPVGSLTRARWSHILDSDDDIHTAFALEGSLDELLFISGPAIATVLATSVWAPLGLMVSTIGAVIGIGVLLALRSTEPPPRGVDQGSSLGFRLPVPVIAVTLIALGLGMMFGALDISTVAFAEEQGVKSQAGLVLGVIALGSFLGGISYGARRWRMALWKRTILGTVVLAVGFSALSFVPNVWMFAVVGFFAGATIAPTITNSDTVVQRVVRRDQITEGMAWLRIGLGIGVAIGAWVAGYLIDQTGARHGLIATAVAAGTAFLAAVACFRWLQRGTTRPELERSPDAPPPALQGADFAEQPPIPPNL